MFYGLCISGSQAFAGNDQAITLASVFTFLTLHEPVLSEGGREMVQEFLEQSDCHVGLEGK